MQGFGGNWHFLHNFKKPKFAVLNKIHEHTAGSSSYQFWSLPNWRFFYLRSLVEFKDGYIYTS